MNGDSGKGKGFLKNHHLIKISLRKEAKFMSYEWKMLLDSVGT